MGRLIQPAKLSGRAGITVQSHKYATGQTFVKGAALALSSGEVIEATSPITGATLYGIALEAAGSRPGYDMGHSPTVVTGRSQEVSVARCTRDQIFAAQLVNNSATPVTPTQADIGVNYGLKAYSGEWYVDKNQTTTNACVTIVDIDTDLNIVYFKPMEARLQVP